MDQKASDDARSFWDFWRRPRIVDGGTLERVEDQMAPACFSRWPSAAMDRRPQDHRGIALAARWKGALIGGATLEVHERTAVIRALHIDPSWHRKGVGGRLLRALLRRARFQFASEVYVLATAADAGFYALHGFRPVDDRKHVRDLSSRLISAALKVCGRDDRAVTLMRRPLTTGLMRAPHDGITMKM